MTPRIIALALPVALTLALSGQATAKQIQQAEVCGSGGCRDITSAVTSEGFFSFGMARTSAPKDGFYRVRMSVGDGSRVVDTFPFLVSPAAGKARVEGEHGEQRWVLVTPATARRFAALVTGLAPYPAWRLGAGATAGEPAARVVETFQPARSDGGSGGSAAPIGVAAAIAVAVLGAFWWRRRRPSRPRRPAAAG